MSTDAQSSIGALSVRYQSSPALRALLSLVPGWSAADALLMQRAEEIKRSRMRLFFDELANSPGGLTEEIAQTEDFIHCFQRTAAAALNTRRGEKIQLFARLLRAATRQGVFSNIDEFEDLLDILASTSARELAVLTLLWGYEQRELKQEGVEDIKRILEYWPRFRAEASENLSIPIEEFPAFMARLERTALFTSSMGAVWDENGEGRTTPLFARLAAMVLADGSPWEVSKSGAQTDAGGA